MNKKIIAIAVATVMAAPVAMADVKISGRVGGELTFVPANGASAAGSKGTAYVTDTTKSSRQFSDFGSSNRLVFDGTMGNAYARNAYNDSDGGRSKQRELLAGYKLSGGSSFQFGRMPTAGKNLEKDPYITTFLQARDSAAIVGTNKNFTSNGFVDGLIQYKTKAGGTKIVVQYAPSNNYGIANGGQFALGVSGKAGAVRYFASYNNGSGNSTGTSSTNQSNAKGGVSMKMGSVKMTLVVSDAVFGSSGANKRTATTLLADFGLGNGLSANVGYGGNGDTGTWARAAVSKKLNKGTNIFAGVVNSKAVGGTAYSVLGAGMIVKF